MRRRSVSESRLTGSRGSRGSDAGVEPLTKPRLLQVSRSEAGLRAHQDEKLDIYGHQHNRMAGVFDRAREVRLKLGSDHEAQNRQVLDRLQGMKISIDRTAKSHVDRMQLLFEELEAAIHGKKEAWQQRLVEDQARLLERRDRCAAFLDAQDEAIRTETVECRRHAEAEKLPVWEKLRAHDASLRQQVEERHQQQSDYAEALQEGFERLKRKIRAEATARQEGWANAKTEKLAAGYQELIAAHSVVEQTQKEGLLKTRQLLQEESVERSEHHAIVNRDMTNFQEKFLANFERNREARKTNGTRLESIKASFKPV